MAITYSLKKKINNVQFRSGHIYTFRYSHWHNDPNPTIILMGITSGYHPNTGHEHHYLSAINFTYVPRQHRKAFARIWKTEFERNNGNVEFIWPLVQARFPYLEHAVRRYWYKPRYMLTNIKHIPLENIEEVVVSTWSKDFSKKLRTDLARKYTRVQTKKRRTGGFMSNLLKNIMTGRR